VKGERINAHRGAPDTGVIGALSGQSAAMSRFPPIMMRLLSSAILTIAPWSVASGAVVEVSPTPTHTVAPTATVSPRELAAFMRANYTKHEHEIAMRDGVRLHTAIYVPKDES